MSAQSLLENADWVRDLAGKLVRDPNQADDLAQETMLIALNSRQEVPSSWRAWLATVMRHLAWENQRRGIRRRRREQVASLDESQPSTLERVEDQALQRQLASKVMALPVHYRCIILKRYFNGQTPTEIGLEESIPVSTVKTRLARALELLRTSLDEEHSGNRGAWVSAFTPWLLRGVTQVTAVVGKTPWSPWLIFGTTLVASVAVIAVVLLSGKRGESFDLTRSPDQRSEIVLREPPQKPRPVEEERDSISRMESEVTFLESSRALNHGLRETKGKVVGIYGEPISGVIVRGVDVGETKDLIIAPVSEDGTFIIRGGRTSSRLVVGSRGYATLVAGTVGSEGECLIVAAMSTERTGRIQDEFGSLIAEATVEVEVPDLLNRFHDSLMQSAPVRMRTQCDDKGFFVLKEVPSVDPVSLLVQSPGYFPWHGDIPGSGEVSIALTPFESEAGGIVGRLLNERGEAVDGAWVGNGVAVDRSDAQGRFALPRTGSQSMSLVAAKEGYRPLCLILELSSEESSSEFDLVLKANPLSVKGRVLDETGQPLAGIWVDLCDPTLLNSSDSSPSESATYFDSSWLTDEDVPRVAEYVASGSSVLRRDECLTDSLGHYELDGLHDRNYRISFMDQSSLLRTEVVVQGGTENFEVILDSRSLLENVEGRVFTPDGKVVVGARVRVMANARSLERNGEPLFRLLTSGESTRTDDRGQFRLRRVPKGGAYLVIEEDSIIPLRHDLQEAWPATFVVTPKRELILSVADTRSTHAVFLDSEGLPLEICRRLADRLFTAERVLIKDGKSPLSVVPADVSAILIYADDELLIRWSGFLLEENEVNNVIIP